MNVKTVIATLIISGLSTCVFAQRVTTVTIDGVNYAAISSEGMPKGYEKRDTTVGNPTSLYYRIKLYTYSETGKTPPPEAVYPDSKYSWPVYVSGNSGDVVQIKKMVRHYEGNEEGSYSYTDESSNGIFSSYNPNRKVSTLFAVAPTDICDNGVPAKENDESAKMIWATAAGFLVSAHSIDYKYRSSATQTGCYMYRGKNGTDPHGTWRLPVKRELILMSILKVPLQNTKNTDFVPFLPQNYWSITEDDILSDDAKQAHAVQFTDIMKIGTPFGYNKSRVRCIRDILLPEESKK